MIKRRAFITLLGGAAATWPLAARAQPSGKLTTIGFLGGATEPATRTWLAAFVQRLRELGWIEGRTVAIEVRWAEGHFDRFADIAADKQGVGSVACEGVEDRLDLAAGARLEDCNLQA